MLRFKSSFVLALFPLSALFWNCQNGGSELPNEIRGSLVDANHKPAVNAKVGLYSVNYIPGDTGNRALSLTTRTDASGQYVFKDIPTGEYNVVGSLDTLGFFRDSVPVSGAGALGSDTLKVLGFLSGRVQLQPQDDPRTSIVQVMGTEHYVNVGADGRFVLAGLPEGTHRLRVFVALPNYVPLFAEVRVRSGIHDSLSNPLVPFYSGIPVVTGIRVTLDTVRGVAKVAWQPVSYPGLLSYLVYRDPANAVNLSQTPINLSRVTDTVYFDSLYRSPFDTAPHDWEYRVRVQATSGKLGDPYQPGLLRAVSPSTIATAIRLSPLGAHGDSASIKDTVRITADFSNPSFANQRLAWILGASDTLRRANLSGKTGQDTLVWVAPDTAVVADLSLRIVDAAGRIWTRSLSIRVLRDPPRVDAGRDTLVGYGTVFALQGAGMDVFGRIVKWEWDIGGAGAFAASGSGDTAITLPGFADSAYRCVLRATDDDGVAALDTIRLHVTTSRIAGEMIFPGFVLHSFPWRGTILSVATLYGSLKLDVESFDPATGISTHLATLGGQGVTALANDKLYAFQPQSDTATTPDSSIMAFDLVAGTWAKAGALPVLMGILDVIEVGGKIYVAGDGDALSSFDKPQMWEFDPSVKTWTRKADMPWQRTAFRLCANMGKVYAFGGQRMSGDFNGDLDEFDPAANAWRTVPDISMANDWFGAAWFGGKFLAFGGLEYEPGKGLVSVNRVEEFDFASRAWRKKPPMLFLRSANAVCVLGSKAYVMGGSSGVDQGGFSVAVTPIEEYQP